MVCLPSSAGFCFDIPPRVLQSDNGREFVASIISQLASLWPELALVNGRPRHPQSRGSVERGSSSVKDALVAWMRDNETAKRTFGLGFVQWGINTTQMSPYEATV